MTNFSRWLFLLLLVGMVSLLLLPTSSASRFQNKPSREAKAETSTPATKVNKSTQRKSAAGNASARSFAKSRAAALPQAASPTPVSSAAVNFAESAPLSQIATESAAVEFDQEENEAAENRTVRDVTAAAISRAQKMSTSEAMKGDAAIQTSAPTLSIPSPITTFEGLGRNENIAAGFGNLSPPDTNGYVGPNHYVQQTNLLVRVWNKAGVPLTAPFRLSSLFAPMGGQCAAPDAGDPIVLYDPLADRWILSQFAFTATNAPPYHECIAVSKNGDPTGSYYLYDFVTPGNEFPDYPHLGVWPDGYYMMVHQFTNGGPFNGTGAYSFNRAKMLVGDPTANFIYFNLNLTSHPEGIGGGLFADLDGLNPPPAGAPNIFAYLTATDFADPANGIRLFNFHADFAVPANSTFTERPESSYAAPVPVAAFSLVNPSGRRDVPQPAPASGVTMALDSISDRFMHRLQYRNRGGGVETLVLNHTVGAPGSTVFGTYRAAPRYYELRNTGSGYAVNEQATFAPADGVSRWMGSAAEDNQGNLAIGYSASSGAAGGNVFPSIRYAGRLATDPPNGLFQGEATLIAGTGVQTSTGNRWGDYSALTVDPTDDCTFWYTQEYYTAAGQAASAVGWQTRIGNFKFAQCTAPAMGTLSGTITYCEGGAPVAGAIVQLSDGHSGTTLADGTYSIKVSPGTYTVQVSAGNQNCMSSASASVSISDGGTTSYSTCLSGTPKPTITSAMVSGGNGDGVINFDECNMLNINLANPGCAGATGISAVLSSTTPGVTVEQPNSPYANIPIGGNATNMVPFEFSTSPTFVCGTMINFTLTVTTAQGVFVLNFSKPTCGSAPINLSGSIGAGDPTQTGRLFRNGVASSCAVPKATPTLVDSVARRYDAYSFTNTTTSTTCVTVTVTSGCSTNLYYASYLGSFNPSNIQTNYLADAGASFAGTATFSFNVPAGQTFVLVLHEVATTGCASYTATVSGLLSGTDGGGVCQACMINPQSNITINNDPDQCGAVVTFPAATSTGSCGVLTTSPASGSFFPVGTTTVTTTSTSGASSSFTVTVVDNQPPAVSSPTATPAMLWPPNHKMRDVMVNYTASDNCPNLNCVLSVTSNEPVNGTGDGDTSPDWEIVDATHVRLRAERAGTGSGRIYTIKVTCTDASGNMTMKTTTVVVAHNISAPMSGASFKINTPVNFAGTFWDLPGKRHTAQWVFDGLTTTSGTVVEPSGLTSGTVRGTYTFTTPGVYAVTMKVIDNTGVTSSVATAGDLEAIVVIYDPNGGYTIGGGWVPAAAGSYPADPSLSGKLSFGFNSKYTNATNPKGETQIQFALGNLDFNALNYDYLAISGARAQFKGAGKFNGDGGYNFILTVFDGQATGGGSVDKFRIKIWNRSTGAIVFDTQMGASDAADPTTPVGDGSSIIIQK